jgi:hypothetical protein
MKKGYYTDKQGNVLGYFELPTVPENVGVYNWVESTERPALYVPPPTPEQEIAQNKSALAISDYKILKKLEKLLPADDADVVERQGKRNRINELEAL